MTRQFWRARLRLSGDAKTDKANREAMLDVLHESLVRARMSNREALARGPIQIGEVSVAEPVPEQPTACPVNGCGADGRGTINGSKPMLCGGYGFWDPRCMGNWAATDPEDREPYEAYLRELKESTDGL